MKDTINKILDKIIPGLIIGLIVTAINLYVQVQVLEVKLKSLTTNYEDIVEQINSQLQRR